MESKTKQRRRHDPELKARVLKACEEPGASVAAVAREYGLNDNLVHQWRRGRGVGRLAATGQEREASMAPQFIELPLPGSPTAVAASPSTPMPTTDIRLEIRRGTVVVNVAWPMTQAGQCATWLREVLR